MEIGKWGMAVISGSYDSANSYATAPQSSPMPCATALAVEDVCLRCDIASNGAGMMGVEGAANCYPTADCKQGGSCCLHVERGMA